MSAISPAVVAAAARAAFDRAYRQTCACAPLELREEHHRWRCARCDAPILRRRRVEEERRHG